MNRSNQSLRKEEWLMVNEEPKVSDFGRYSINETSKLLGIHRNTLLCWTNAGKIRCGYRRATMRKFYEGREIKRIWRAHY